MTNLEKIRNMSNEELALFLIKVFCKEIAITPKCTNTMCEEKYCNKCTENWLLQDCD